MSNFYAVKVGKTPGVYDTWDDCKAQVDGFSGAKYKKFGTKEEAEAFVGGEKATTKAKDSNKESKPITASSDSMPYSFVDGSFNPSTGVYGYGGFVCVNGKHYPVMGSDNDPEMATMRNVAGEIAGSMAAVKKAEELGIKKMRILYDYQGIESWAKSQWKTNKQGTIDYKVFMNDPARTVTVEFEKVKGHSGVEGNEMADVIAKSAVGIKLTNKQKELFDKAMNMSRRDGIDLESYTGLAYEEDYEPDM